MARVNKTENNLKQVWEKLDIACESLEGAMCMIESMVDMPNNVTEAMEQIDFTAIVSLKEQIEILMEQKEK